MRHLPPRFHRSRNKKKKKIPLTPLPSSTSSERSEKPSFNFLRHDPKNLDPPVLSREAGVRILTYHDQEKLERIIYLLGMH